MRTGILMLLCLVCVAQMAMSGPPLRETPILDCDSVVTGSGIYNMAVVDKSLSRCKLTIRIPRTMAASILWHLPRGYCREARYNGIENPIKILEEDGRESDVCKASLDKQINIFAKSYDSDIVMMYRPFKEFVVNIRLMNKHIVCDSVIDLYQMMMPLYMEVEGGICEVLMPGSTKINVSLLEPVDDAQSAYYRIGVGSSRYDIEYSQPQNIVTPAVYSNPCAVGGIRLYAKEGIRARLKFSFTNFPSTSTTCAKEFSFNS